MHAQNGDMMIIKAHHVGEHDRTAEVLEVRGPHGDPPYLVRWDDTGRISLVFPGSDAQIKHLHQEQHQ